MRARIKVLLALLVVGGVTGISVGASGATHFPLFGPFGGAHCDGSGITAGSDLGFGFATITGEATIKAKVTATTLTPDTTYYVRLIQGEADCGVADASFTTNKHGKGHVNVHEASVSGDAYVFIFNGRRPSSTPRRPTSTEIGRRPGCVRIPAARQGRQQKGEP
jgi:hypothetical protein